MVVSIRRAEIRNLKRLARKAKDTRMRLRYDVIRLYLEGRTKSEIADIFAITYQTARNYINAYTSAGIEGLQIGKPSGRPTKLNKEQEQLLYPTFGSCNISSLYLRRWIFVYFQCSTTTNFISIY